MFLKKKKKKKKLRIEFFNFDRHLIRRLGKRDKNCVENEKHVQVTSLRTQFHSDFVTQKKPWRSFREANFPKVPSNVSLYQMTIVIFHKGISANSRLKSAGSYRPRMRRCQSLYFETCSYRPRIHFFSSSNSKEKKKPQNTKTKRKSTEKQRDCWFWENGRLQAIGFLAGIAFCIGGIGVISCGCGYLGYWVSFLSYLFIYLFLYMLLVCFSFFFFFFPFITISLWSWFLN